jgi:ribonuclease P protein component
MSTNGTERDTAARVRLRLTRAQRLRGRSAVTTVFRRARRVGSSDLAVLFRENGLSAGRVLVSTRRGFKGAVERNRERRRVREIYRQIAPRLRAGYDVAVVVNPPPRSYAARRAQLESLLRRAGLLLS